MIRFMICIAILHIAASRNTSNLIVNANLTAPQQVPLNQWRSFPSLDGWSCHSICQIAGCNAYPNSAGCQGTYLDLNS